MSKKVLSVEQQMLHELNDFLHTSVLLTAAFKQENDKMVLVPNIVVSAFTLELALKCLLTIRQTDVKRQKKASHNLKRLFYLLSKKDQQRIIAIHGEQNVHKGGTIPEANSYFHEALEFGKEDFTTVRYVYEKLGGHETRNLGSLILAVYAYIFEVCPQWIDYQIHLNLTSSE